MPSAAPSTVSSRPWWLAPGPMIFGLSVVVLSAAILLQDVVFPPKPVDPRTKVVQPGGATFCDPPVPPLTPPELSPPAK